MGTYREQDPLTRLVMREQARVLEGLVQFANGGGKAALNEARLTLCALRDAETEVLYPAFSRLRLRPDIERLLDDSRGNRTEQLDALDALAQKRGPRLRKLAMLALSDLIKQHDERHTTLLIPVLASQLARPLYRCIAQAFITRYEGALTPLAGASSRRSISSTDASS